MIAPTIWFLTGLQERALLCVLTEAVLEVPTVVGMVQHARLRGRRRRLAVLPAERVRQVQVDMAAEGTVPRVPGEVRAGVVRCNRGPDKRSRCSTIKYQQSRSMGGPQHGRPGVGFPRDTALGGHLDYALGPYIGDDLRPGRYEVYYETFMFQQCIDLPSGST